MTVLKAHFDGKVLIPDGPVNLPVNCPLELSITAVEPMGKKPLLDLVAALKALPHNEAWPADGAAEHDHYLYGVDKRG